jgi:hypothetical protein
MKLVRNVYTALGKKNLKIMDHLGHVIVNMRIILKESLIRIHLAQNRVQRRAVVNTMIEVQLLTF